MASFLENTADWPRRFHGKYAGRQAWLDLINEQTRYNMYLVIDLEDVGIMARIKICKIVGCPDEKTFRKWSQLFVNGIFLVGTGSGKSQFFV